MISFRVQNVRSIKDSGEIPLKPLTLVVGRNSVGKSALVRWLPLLAQSIGAPGSTPILWSRRDRGLVDYGSFQETVTRGAEPEAISYYWASKLDRAMKFLAGTLLTNEGGATRLGGGWIYFGNSIMSLATRASEQNDATANLWVMGRSASELAPGWTWRFESTDIFPRLKATGPSRLDRLPGQPQRVEALKALKRTRMDSQRLEAMAETAGGFTPAGLRASLASHDRATATWSADLKSMSDDDPRLLALLPHFIIRDLTEVWNQIHIQLNQVLSSLLYVGPFRAEPRRAERSPEPSKILDSRGEALTSFVEGLTEDERHDLAGWLNEAMGFKLRLKREGLYSELRVDQGEGGDDNLADVGFGIGQVLPVAVHLWNASREKRPDPSIPRPVIIEQPELHLHPAHQARVGQMLCRFAARAEQHGGRLLVETHSESLINAVGEEIAKGKLAQDAAAVVVLDRPGGGDVRVQVAEFDAKGNLSEPWPFDFFSA